MPIFFQHQISETTRLGVWKIEETEEFFKGNVPQHRDVTHPHKRLQHLAGRFLLQYLFPDFPYELILIADTRKPYLKDEEFHFSISHCGDYAAAIVSKDRRVGIDIEIPLMKILQIQHKFISEEEKKMFLTPDSGLQTPDSGLPTPDADAFGQHPDIYRRDSRLPTLLWSAKESVFKWYGNGGVDFKKHIQLKKQHEGMETLDCYFTKTNDHLTIHYRLFEQLALSWVIS